MDPYQYIRRDVVRDLSNDDLIKLSQEADRQLEGWKAAQRTIRAEIHERRGALPALAGDEWAVVAKDPPKQYRSWRAEELMTRLGEAYQVPWKMIREAIQRIDEPQYKVDARKVKALAKKWGMPEHELLSFASVSQGEPILEYEHVGGEDDDAPTQS